MRQTSWLSYYAPRALFLLTVIVGAMATILAPPHAESISGGANHTCAVMSNGAVRCWGNNDYGKLGLGDGQPYVTAPTEVLGISSATMVSARTFHTCAVLSDGHVSCWGRNHRGQLGDGTQIDASSPTLVAGITNAIAVDSGVFHSCALLSTGAVSCWGYNGFGQLGDGTYRDSSSPIVVQGISDAIAIATGGDHSCAILVDRTVKCWGWNAQGQIGAGSSNETFTSPTRVDGITDAVSISSGDYYSCAALANGEAKCWGLNGAGDTPLAIIEHKDISGDVELTWPSVGGGATYTVAARVKGGTLAEFQLQTKMTSAKMVGLRPNTIYDFTVTAHYSGADDGQLGNGTFVNSRTPVPVVGISNAIKIEAGYATTCALLASQQVACWGRNINGELGVGSAFPTSPTPTLVGSLENAVDVSASGSPCAVLTTAAITCWGANYYGQLGDGTQIDAHLPVLTLEGPPQTNSQ